MTWLNLRFNGLFHFLSIQGCGRQNPEGSLTILSRGGGTKKRPWISGRVLKSRQNPKGSLTL